MLDWRSHVTRGSRTWSAVSPAVSCSVAVSGVSAVRAALFFHFQFADPTFGQFSVTHSDFQLLSTDYDSPLHYADFELKSIFLAIIVGTMFVTIVYMKVDQLK